MILRLIKKDLLLIFESFQNILLFVVFICLYSLNTLQASDAMTAAVLLPVIFSLFLAFVNIFLLYDFRKKTLRQIVSLPIDTKDIVFSKYTTIFIISLFVMVFSTIVSILYKILIVSYSESAFNNGITINMYYFFFTIAFFSVYMPLIFKIKCSKAVLLSGVMNLAIIICAIKPVFGSWLEYEIGFFKIFDAFRDIQLICLTGVATFTLFMISLVLSIRIFNKYSIF